MKIHIVGGALLFFSLSAVADVSDGESQRYREDRARIASITAALAPGRTNDLGRFETLMDEIRRAWQGADKVYYGQLMLAACEPLTSGSFESGRSYELAGSMLSPHSTRLMPSRRAWN
jgi:hypothetical protein